MPSLDATSTTFFTNVLKSSPRATKSVWQLTSTMTPFLPSGLTHVADFAFGGDLAGARRGLHEALLQDDLDSLVEVAFGLHERVLAVGHAGRSALAELLDHCGSDRSHGASLLLSGRLVFGRAGSRGRRSAGAIGGRRGVGAEPGRGYVHTARLPGDDRRPPAAAAAATVVVTAAVILAALRALDDASAMRAVISLIERIASSLPGMTKST